MSTLCPPTVYLPPIAKIAFFSVTQLLDALTYLQSLYHPEVRGSRRKPKVQDIRFDAFERSYSIRWLTVLIAKLEIWQDSLHSGEVSLDDLGKPEPSFAHVEMLVERAASLLAICAGVAAAGTITRNFIFGSMDGQRRVEAQLTDIPLENDDYGSVGAQTWGGACVLAEMIVEDPKRFGLDLSSGGAESRRFNVLELGAGTGLDRLSSFENCEVSVSNINANFPSTHDPIISTHSITTHFLDWSSFSTTPRPDCLSCPFDVVFGADIIYEAQHAVWIRDCLKGLMRCPSDGIVSPATFHLVIPLRPTHAFESSTVESVFLEACDIDPNGDADLVILSKESITCDAHCDYTRRGGLGEDVEYVYYKIGWSNVRL
ncbi:uncharacterized protein EDB91DRAFT_1157179 [Suillus paluster]|uniref:uncharacterized protein n=1 Tax=Suillus paluster TaxID=48578 RepID=UPI001B873BBC|nr:uncharacterized protein EDB91DRAFT_1157179 [Suillus paluster]KAG1730384.1 hypothetical protein EDB91DRAFT_1157179 [Suillus paluster]